MAMAMATEKYLETHRTRKCRTRHNQRDCSFAMSVCVSVRVRVCVFLESTCAMNSHNSKNFPRFIARLKGNFS